MRRELTYATVCSGVECMSAAAIGLPLRPVFFSEIEPFPCAVLKHRFPAIPNLGDMSRITVNEKGEITNGRTTVALPAGGLDILAGGTPCQDVSNAGRRRGMAEGSGTRSSLAFEFVRLVRAIRPRYVLWENVAGVLSDPSFPKFLAALADCGYGVAYRTLDAQFVRCEDIHLPDGGVVRLGRAVPQRRRRVWAVGCAGGDVRKASQVLLEHSSALGDRPPRRKARPWASAAPRRGDPLPGRVVEGERGVGEPRPAATAQAVANFKANLAGGDVGTASVSGDHDSRLTDLTNVLVETRAVTNTNGGDVMPTVGCDMARATGNQHDKSGGYVIERRVPLATHNFECYDNAQGVSVTLGARRAGDTLEIEAPLGFKCKPSGKARSLGEGKEASPCLSASSCDASVAFGINANGVTETAAMPFRMECADPLATRHQGGVVQLGVAAMRFLVRRTTPTECERLMGLPDGWTIPAFAPGEITDALVAEFMGIHDAYGAIMAGYAGKAAPRPKSAKWVRGWLERIANPATCPDSPRYKGIGNGWATNQPRWIVLRIFAVEGIDPWDAEDIDTEDNTEKGEDNG